MVQTRTFRVDVVDLSTGSRVGNGKATCGRPASATGGRGSGGRIEQQHVLPAPRADIATHHSATGSIAGSSRAGGGPESGSSDADQQRFLVPVIDWANHSTLAAGVNAELRLGAGGSGGLRFALDAREPLNSELPCLSLPS